MENEKKTSCLTKCFLILLIILFIVCIEILLFKLFNFICFGYILIIIPVLFTLNLDFIYYKLHYCKEDSGFNDFPS